jgi:hypothetical protein
MLNGIRIRKCARGTQTNIDCPAGEVMGRRNDRKEVRYAVVGLGHIAQVAVLPAFAHATEIRFSRRSCLVIRRN